MHSRAFSSILPHLKNWMKFFPFNPIWASLFINWTMVRVIKRQGIQNPFNAFLNKKPFHHLTHSVMTSTLINSIECFILWVHYNVRNDFLRMASADVWNDTFWSQKTNQFWCKFLTMPQSPAGASSICITQQLVLVPRRQKFSTLFQLSPSIQQVAKKTKAFRVS